MPMFESDEAFEAYVAEQQAELASGQIPPEHAGPQSQPKALEQWQKFVGVVVPAALAVVIGIAIWRNAPDGQSQYTDPWDKILSTTAWMGGRKYNANADTLTGRLTFSEPLENKKSDE